MELVVDANVLVAGFLRSATTRELLLDERLRLSSPEWSLIETERVLATPQFRRRLGGLTTADAALTQQNVIPVYTTHEVLDVLRRLSQ